MGAHQLRDIVVVGKSDVLAAIPDFDLHHLHRVVGLCLFQTDADLSSDDYTMQLEVEYEGARGVGVVLEFSGVKTATLPLMMPSFCFGELEIDDVSRDQLEGVRFRAKDHGMTDFEILCKAVAIRLRARCASAGINRQKGKDERA